MNTESLVRYKYYDNLYCDSLNRYLLNMLLLCFIILDLTGHRSTSNSIHHTENF